MEEKGLGRCDDGQSERDLEMPHTGFGEGGRAHKPGNAGGF